MGTLLQAQTLQSLHEYFDKQLFALNTIEVEICEHHYYHCHIHVSSPDKSIGLKPNEWKIVYRTKPTNKIDFHLGRPRADIDTNWDGGDGNQ